MLIARHSSAGSVAAFTAFRTPASEVKTESDADAM